MNNHYEPFVKCLSQLQQAAKADTTALVVGPENFEQFKCRDAESRGRGSVAIQPWLWFPMEAQWKQCEVMVKHQDMGW